MEMMITIQIDAGCGEVDVEVPVELEVEVLSWGEAEAPTRESPGCPGELELACTLGRELRCGGVVVLREGHVLTLPHRQMEEIATEVRERGY